MWQTGFRVDRLRLNQLELAEQRLEVAFSSVREALKYLEREPEHCTAHDHAVKTLRYFCSTLLAAVSAAGRALERDEMARRAQAINEELGATTYPKKPLALRKLRSDAWQPLHPPSPIEVAPSTDPAEVSDLRQRLEALEALAMNMLDEADDSHAVVSGNRGRTSTRKSAIKAAAGGANPKKKGRPVKSARTKK
jgi:hypothetical protein